MKTKSEVFLTIDVFIGTVPVTEISTLDPGYISTTAGTEMLGGTVFEKYNCWKINFFIKIYLFIKLIATDKNRKRKEIRGGGNIRQAAKDGSNELFLCSTFAIRTFSWQKLGLQSFYNLCFSYLYPRYFPGVIDSALRRERVNKKITRKICILYIQNAIHLGLSIQFSLRRKAFLICKSFLSWTFLLQAKTNCFWL